MSRESARECTRSRVRIFTCQLTLYSRRITRVATPPSVKRRESTKVNIQCWEKSETRKQPGRRTRERGTEGASGSARGAFMEGLRFRRLANVQECQRLTAEWDLENRWSSPRSLAKGVVAVLRVFSLPPLLKEEQWKSGRKRTPVRLRWKLS